MQQYVEVEKQARCVRLEERSQGRYPHHKKMSVDSSAIYLDDAVCSCPFIDLSGNLNQEKVQECCINRNGFAYNLFEQSNRTPRCS